MTQAHRIAELIAVLVAILAVYYIWVRPYLKSLPALNDLWTFEHGYWGAFKAWLDGRKTVLVGLWGTVIAFAPDFLQQASGFDLKTLLGLPDQWAAWVTAFIPVIMLVMRTKATAKTVEQPTQGGT